jgi:hypothetical protein
MIGEAHKAVPVAVRLEDYGTIFADLPTAHCANVELLPTERRSIAVLAEHQLIVWQASKLPWFSASCTIIAGFEVSFT